MSGQYVDVPVFSVVDFSARVRLRLRGSRGVGGWMVGHVAMGVECYEDGLGFVCGDVLGTSI